MRRPVLLSRGTTSHYVHSRQAPYSGPAGRDKISRRLSSHLTRKHRREAKERGEYVDIHAIGGTDPGEYDDLTTDMKDIKHQALENIVEGLGIPYPSRVGEAEAKALVKVGNGYIHGLKSRAIAPFIVGHQDEARWVFFILATGAPLTYLSDQVSDRRLTSIDKGYPWCA